MHFNIVVAVIFSELLGFLMSSDLPECGVNSENNFPEENRILGGEMAHSGEFPWVVAIYQLQDCISFKFACLGTIINEYWVVTAATCICVPTVPERYRLYGGINDLSNLNVSTVERIEVAAIFVHPDYKERTFSHDIALMQSSWPIHISRTKIYVNRICMPTSTEDPTGDVTIAGFGPNSDNLGKRRMQKLGVTMIERPKCNRHYDRTSSNVIVINSTDPDWLIDVITESVICAGRRRVDACWGSNGGPLMKRNEEGIYTLIGILQGRDVGCARHWSYNYPFGFPRRYTKVSLYLPWIKTIMENPDYEHRSHNKLLTWCNREIDGIYCFPEELKTS